MYALYNFGAVEPSYKIKVHMQRSGRFDRLQRKKCEQDDIYNEMAGK